MPMGNKHVQDSVLSVLFAFTKHANFLNITKTELQCPRRFVFSPFCSPRHCVTQSTEVLGWVFPMSWYFPQVEGLLTTPKFSLKTFDAWNKIVSRHVLQEKLESLVGVLHVPEEGWWNRKWVVALQLQTCSFRDSDVVIRLGHWLGSSSCWNINAESVNSAKTKSLCSTRSNIPCVDKGIKWSSTHLETGASQASSWTPRSWWSSEAAVSSFLTGSPQMSLMTGWLEPRFL